MYGGSCTGRCFDWEVYPDGHLTATWARDYFDYPSADSYGALNGNLDDEYYNEGIYVGYRYFDSLDITPSYPSSKSNITNIIKGVNEGNITLAEFQSNVMYIVSLIIEMIL